MKNLLSFIGSFLILILQAIVVSAFFTACQWSLSLMDIVDNPTWTKFLYGSLGIFCFLFIVSCCKTAIEMYRMYKDPIYKEAAIRTGIDWNSYKRISIKKNDESEKSYNHYYVKLGFCLAYMAYLRCKYRNKIEHKQINNKELWT